MSRDKKNKKPHHDESDAPVGASVVDSDAVDDAPAPDDAENAEALADVEDAAEDPVAALQREVSELKDKFLRAKAEQQNAQRRAENERNEALRYANGSLLRDLLEVVDDFDRALDAAESSETVKGVVDGVSMVQEKLHKFLRDHHVERIEAADAPFDPAQHEALMQQPTTDHEPGTVVQQVQPGYRLRERVLRPAKVIVACAPPEAESADGE